MAATQTINLPRASDEGITTFLWVVLFVHILDVLLGRPGMRLLPDFLFFMLYVIALSLYGAFGPFKKTTVQGTLRALMYLVVLGLISWAVPYIVNRVNWNPTVVMSILALFPLYPVWIYFTHAGDFGKWTTRLARFWIILWVVILLGSHPQVFQTFAATTQNFLGEDSPTVSPGAFMLSQIQRGYNGIKTLVTASFTKPREFLNESINFATGDAYTARVDRNAKADLGVSLGDINLIQPEFTTADRIGFFSTLEAQTIEDILRIRINCTAKDDQRNTVNPGLRESLTPDTSEDPIEIAQQETVDIDCVYRAGAIPAGRPSLSLSAEWDMVTLAYLRTYFMDRDRLRELRAANIDPFQQYGITDRNPVTIYTSGPVSLGMGFSTPPVGIDTEQDEFTTTLGISVKNEWPGKIENVSFIAVFVPKGFQLTALGGATVEQTRCSDLIPPQPDWCDDTTSNLYAIKPEISKAIDTGQAITARARLRAPRSEYDTILGTTPISGRLFKAAVDYTYELEKSRTILVKGSEEGAVQPTNQIVKLVGNPVVDVDINNATVSFLTDVAAPAEIKYCRGASTITCTPIVKSSPTVSAEHKFNLIDLQPNTLYAYEISSFSSACSGGRCKHGDYTLTTGTTS